MSVGNSVYLKMAKGKVVSTRVHQEGKKKVQEKSLTPVQEEGLRRAFARKAILSPRYSIQEIFLADAELMPTMAMMMMSIWDLI